MLYKQLRIVTLQKPRNPNISSFALYLLTSLFIHGTFIRYALLSLHYPDIILACVFFKRGICESEIFLFCSATRFSALQEPSVNKYYYLSESAYQQVWKYTFASDPAITRSRVRTSLLVINITFLPVPKHTRPGYWVAHYYPLHSSTPSPPHSVSGAPPWLVTPPSRAQQPVCEVGMHGWSMHWEWSEGGEGVYGLLL